MSLQHSPLYVVVGDGETNSVLELAKVACRRSVRLGRTAHSLFLLVAIIKEVDIYCID
jgi:hypothetical protein